MSIGLCHTCFTSNVELVICNGIPKCEPCSNIKKCEDEDKV